MPHALFGVGTTVATITNIETLIAIPPVVLPDHVFPLVGGVEGRPMSNNVRYDGSADSELAWDALGRRDFNALIYYLFDNWTTGNATRYLSGRDESWHYSPFLATLQRPHIRDHYTLLPDGSVQNLVIPVLDLQIQVATISANHTVTTSQRYLRGNTAGGNVTFTLFDVASAVLNTVYSFEKTVAANNLILDGHSTQTIDGSATKTLTALNERVDLVTRNGTSWVSV